MTPQQLIKQTLIGALCAFLLDAIVPGFLLKGLYASELHFVLRAQLGIESAISAILVNLLIGFGIAYFVLPQVRKTHEALVQGALFGVMLYGVYEFTNYALIIWSGTIVWIDIIWGTMLCALVSAILFTVAKHKK